MKLIIRKFSRLPARKLFLAIVVSLFPAAAAISQEASRSNKTAAEVPSEMLGDAVPPSEGQVQTARELVEPTGEVATISPEVKLFDPHIKDWVAGLQRDAFGSKISNWGHWGARPDSYSAWRNHSNRLIPVYTFNCSMDAYDKEHSAYRDAAPIEKIYHRLPAHTIDPEANYADQTDIYRLQKDLIDAGKRRVILVIFDGTDWQTTWAAATYNAGQVRYTEGRGTGLAFQDYRGTSTGFSTVVTSPHDDGGAADVDTQRRLPDASISYGGYNAKLGGRTPWERPKDFAYLMNRSRAEPHAVTDSSSSATSMMAGIKTFNGAINVDENAIPVQTIAHWAQSEKGFSVGAVTSVPISHATPACAYAQNVSREDFQDLTRDMLGLPSVMNRESLPGLDVLIGCGWNQMSANPAGQGANYLPGNRYLAAEDLQRATHRDENAYVAAIRTPGKSGQRVLQAGVDKAITENRRLLGFFGGPGGHLPFRTANGDFQPVLDVKGTEIYSHADIYENPLLADMAIAALDVLSRDPDGMWLMIECGDVDWANHANNIDNSIGAVLSGDLMMRSVFDWIETHGGWDDTALIVTSDHGHYLNLSKPEIFAMRNEE